MLRAFRCMLSISCTRGPATSLQAQRAAGYERRQLRAKAVQREADDVEIAALDAPHKAARQALYACTCRRAGTQVLP